MTKVSALIEPVLDRARRAVLAWDGIAALWRDLYPDDLTYGPQSWLRGSWHSRLPEMRAELLDLELLRGYGGTGRSKPDARADAATRRCGPPPAGRRRADDRVRRPASPRATRCGAPPQRGRRRPILHCRHVDQSRPWRATPMQRNGNGFAAEIPAD